MALFFCAGAPKVPKVAVAVTKKEKIEMAKWIGFCLMVAGASLLALPAGPAVTELQSPAAPGSEAPKSFGRTGRPGVAVLV